MAKIKVSDYIFQYLKHCGVSHVFGVPGGGCMHLYNSAHSTPGLTLVPAFHEQAAGFAAQSYSEMKSALGVCLVTAGPGMTNAVTAMAACWIESTPVIFIGGQAKTADSAVHFGVRSSGQQEVNGVAIAAPLTKKSLQLTDASQLRLVLAELVELALSGRRGPVFLEVPLDIQATLIDPPVLNEAEPEDRQSNHADYSQEITRLVDALERSKKPAVLIGAGVRVSGSGNDLIRICEHFDAAILLTWKAFQILPEDHRLNFGRPGGICQPYANDVLQACDLFISVGARNDLVSVAFDYENYAMGSEQRYFVDIDAQELLKYSLSKDTTLAIDAKKFVTQLAQEIRRRGLALDRKEPWIEFCSRAKVDKNILNYHPSTPDYVSTYQMVDAMSELIDENHAIVPGSSGSCSDIFMQTFRVKGEIHIQNAPGLGAMGTGLPAISGAFLAFGGSRKVVSIIGDGGFQFNLQEMQTLKNLDVNATIFVLNNNGYASIRRSQRNHFGSNIHTDKESGIRLTNLEKVAHTFGFYYCQLRNDPEAIAALPDLLSRKGQLLVEVFVDPEEDVRPRVGTRLVGEKIFSANMKEYK